MAFFDDVYMATPSRVGLMYAVVQEELYVHVSTQLAMHWSRSPTSPTQKPWCGQVP